MLHLFSNSVLPKSSTVLLIECIRLLDCPRHCDRQLLLRPPILGRTKLADDARTGK